MININDKQHIREAVHILDPTNRILELFLHSGTSENFFFIQQIKCSIILLRFEISKSAYRGTDCFVVSQHATQPTMTDIWHTRTLSLLFNNLLSCSLCTHKKNLVSFGSLHANDVQSFIKSGDSMLQIYYMNFIARTKDKLAHFWIPKTCLVAEVNASLQHITHAYIRHNISSWG